MRKLLCLAVGLASLSTICSAQTITETFGIGANAFTMDFVTIGNPGNAASSTGFGSVAYSYNLGKYEVSRSQIEKAVAASGISISLSDNDGYDNFSNPKFPAVSMSWYESLLFVNWLNTSKGYAPAYKFSSTNPADWRNPFGFQAWAPGEVGYQANNPIRNSLAKFILPNNDEWIKGAYGSPTGIWYKYTTGSNTAPTAVSGGTSSGTAVYNGDPAAPEYPFSPAGPALIDNAGGLSAFGTMAQGGNVAEWTETASNSGISRDMRGNSWGSDSVANPALFMTAAPWSETDDKGFRVAMVPEPSSLSLLALGGVVVALRRRR